MQSLQREVISREVAWWATPDSGSGEHGQILRWRASENPQSPGLVTFTLS